MDPKLQPLINRSALAWGVSELEAKDRLSIKRQKALRINSLNCTKKTEAELIEYFGLKPIKWAKYCFVITKNYNHSTDHPDFLSGRYILQDSASFLPVIALAPKQNDIIIDLCAAPGTKTSHIASITSNKAQLLANDSSKNRLFKMKRLLSTYGAEAHLSLRDGRNIDQITNENPDKILLDAPCSGEGELNIFNSKTTKTWSLAKVKRLSRLQKQLILQAFDSLKVGGIMVYSTCTVAPEENEMVVEYLLKQRSGATLQPIFKNMKNIKPGISKWNDKLLNAEIIKTVRILPSNEHQAFFVAKIKKNSPTKEDEFLYEIN